MGRHLSRAEFLKLCGTAIGGLYLAACQKAVALTASPLPTEVSTEVPTLPSTATPVVPTATATPAYKALVAIGQATKYDRTALRAELEKMLNALGGLGDIVRPGARVGIKVNLTGAYYQDGVTNPPAVEWFATNPAVVGALCELLVDAGAARIYVMDGLNTAKRSVFDLWGYTDMVKSVGAEMIDLCTPEPYSDFVDVPVGPGWLIYETLTLNPLLGELDTFVSAAKMKPHAFAGVTLSMKNLMGITPLSKYCEYDGQTWRAKIHGDRDMDKRLGRVILDLNRVRPIHLSLIDGVMSMEGGADAWETGVAQVKPGLLVAGKQRLATDTVAAALMGFDATVPSGSVPFLHIENYLQLARENGMGTNLLDEIGVAGPSIQEAVLHFNPAP